MKESDLSMRVPERRWFFTPRTLTGELLLVLVLLSPALLVTGCQSGRSTPPSATAKRPNILFVMIDDLGWRDLGCQGNPAFRTPNIDRFARQGMRFTDAYAAAPVCSPTRAAAMTGLSPARMRITNHIPDQWRFYTGKALGPAQSFNQLDTRYNTIAERLRSVGYKTAMIGKWHLSGTRGSEENRQFLPENQGFDLNIAGNHQGGPGGEGSFFDPFKLPNIPSRKPGEFLPDRLADEAVSFARQQTATQTPFFICLWDYAVHWPIEAPESLYRNYTAGEPTPRQKYQAMVEGMDRAFGRVLAGLEELGVANDTLIVFTSDNGPFTGNNNEFTDALPLRSEKGYLWEGGIRVPLIVRWPTNVRPHTTCQTPVVTMDFVPTFLAAAGVPYAQDEFDGQSLLPVLTGSGELSREDLYFHFPHYAFHRGNNMGSIIRSGSYKLIRHYDTKETLLFDLSNDLGETKNLASQMPDVAARLDQRLQQWLTSVDAAMPRALDEIPADELVGEKK